jgi:hypothetical protein
VNIYTTAFLNGVVDSLLRPPSFLLDMFFPNVVTSEQEEIKFDFVKGKRRIAPFVHPLKEGKVVESLGYETNTFTPAYIKDKRVFDPSKALKRRAGERIGGDASNMDRARANLAVALEDQLGMLTRRLEVMAAEVLRSGKATIKGEGYASVEVDFKRAAGQTLTLPSGGYTKWDSASPTPLDNLEDWALTVAQASGATVTDVLFTIGAWRKFRANTAAKEAIDTQLGQLANFQIPIASIEGLEFKGTIGGKRLWVYTGWYVDPDTGNEVAIIPDGWVILVAQNGLLGTRHFGAIRDEQAGFQAREFFSKSWFVEDPPVRYLMTQSAPLIVPYRPNASMAVKVI